MKLLLLNPLYKFPVGEGLEKYYIRSGSRWPHSGIKKKGALPHYLPFPFYLGYAAALLKKDGFEVSVYDCVATDTDIDVLLWHIAREKPDAVFFETTTPTIEYDLDLAKSVKSISGAIKVILGGAHATTFYDDLLVVNREIDFILLNEYEFSLKALANCLRDNSSPAGVNGICFFNEKREVTRTEPVLIDNLDDLPFPERDIFPSPFMNAPGIYWDGFCQNRPAIQMQASRGCPYKCDFCLWNQVIYKNGRYRTFSPARVVNEMEHVITEYKAREIYFDDDDFTINKDFVSQVCREIINRNLKIKWSCMGDAINLDEGTIKLMARSGCIGMKFGVESGSKSVIPKLGKPIDTEKVRKIAGLCGKYSIKTHATFSLGLLEDSKETMNETVEFISKLDTDTIQVSICTPFPGTAFFDKADKLGLIRTKDWSMYDGKASDVIAHANIGPEEAENMRSAALKKWITGRISSPKWLFRQLKAFAKALVNMGPVFIFSQLHAIWVEETYLAKNRNN